LEVRAGYKQTEAGVIPEDWRLSTMGDEAELLTGFPFPSSGFTKSGVRLLRGSNVKRGAVDWSTEITQHWPAVETKTQAYGLRAGDLVIAMDGALVGRSYATIAASDLPALLVQRVARLRSKKSVQGLLRAWVASDFFVQHVDLVKTHTAIPHISPKDIRQFALVVPSATAEQIAIADALSDVEALLAGLDRLIAKKRDIKQAAMQQLLTGQTRLPGFQGEWTATTLGSIARIQRGASPRPIDSPVWFDENSRVGWVRISDVTRSGMFLDETTQRLSSLGVDHSRQVSSGSLIMSICATVGRPVITRIDVCIHDGFVVFDQLTADQRYLYYVLKWLEPTWTKHGQTGSQMNLNTGLINGAKVHLPPCEEQTEIATVLSDMDAELAALEARRDKTRALKQGMMQELLTGRTRLV
jgi:type I restriction enzyme, S subunit